MAMIPVQWVLEKLSFLIAEETQLLNGVREGINQLQDDLYSMKAFLQDAESRSESDDGVKTWIKQVRDVAFDAEDALEQFMIRSTPSFDQGFVNSLRNWYRRIWNLRAQHRLGNQIQSIKGRVKAISERRNAFSFNRVDMATSSNVPMEPLRIASLYIDEADLVGIENPKSQLITWLVEGGKELTSISVIGMGGLGKTTLVKKVHDSQAIRRSFDCYSWVTVSKLFSPMELLRAALKGFLEATKEPIPGGMELMTDFQLVDALRRYLQQKRYVIVFDDVWSVDAWETIKYAFPDCNCGSRIIFTTRSSSVAASIDITGRHVYYLQPLTEADAWNLFCRKVFRGENEGVCPIELEKMSRNILKRCDGLPLAIVAIGGMLLKKNKVGLEWKKVHDNLVKEFRKDNNLGSLERILLMSYNDLPYYLKLSYLYLSVFPEDYLIKRTKLIRLWVVERIVDEKQGLTMEEVAEDYFNELVSRSMIQVVQMGYLNKVKTCRLHDLMREIVQLKSREASFVMIAANESRITGEKVHRLSIHDNCEDLSISSVIRFPYLRSLLLFVSIDPFRKAFFRSFKLLRVLELERVPLFKFPPELVELIHLRYLSLRSTMVAELPESIKKLKSLEILDLKGSFITSLPTGILQLKHLSQIRNYHYRFGSSIFFLDSHGMRVPSGIGRLTSIQSLGNIEVNDDSEIVRELGKLTQLKRLGILELKEEHGKDLSYTLEKMKHLTALYMVSINSNEFLPLESLPSPPENLQRLFLKCQLSTLPGWIASLQYLSQLVLQYSNLKIDPLKALQALPSLVVLELREAYDGEELCCDGRAYSKLKKLGIYQLQTLQHIRLGEEAMPGLRNLDIAACDKLEKVPHGIEHLKNIQELLLWDMPSNFLKAIERSRGEDHWKVQHIPAITRIYESHGKWATEILS